MNLKISTGSSPYVFDADSKNVSKYLAMNGRFYDNQVPALADGTSIYFESRESAEIMVNRMNKTENDFVWALAQLKDGKYVTLWTDNIYWYMRDDKIYNDLGVERNILVSPHFESTQKKGWRLVSEKKKTIDDVKTNEKFRFQLDISLNNKLVYQRVPGGYLRIQHENGNSCLEVFNASGFEKDEIKLVK